MADVGANSVIAAGAVVTKPIPALGRRGRCSGASGPNASRIVRILFLTHRLPYAPNRGDRIRAYHVLLPSRPDA